MREIGAFPNLRRNGTVLQQGLEVSALPKVFASAPIRGMALVEDLANVSEGVRHAFCRDAHHLASETSCSGKIVRPLLLETLQSPRGDVERASGGRGGAGGRGAARGETVAFARRPSSLAEPNINLPERRSRRALLHTLLPPRQSAERPRARGGPRRDLGSEL